jgi:3-isopropylmalate dehydrogenase
MKLNILVLPGDGIGPEITAEAVKVLQVVCDAFGHELKMTEGLIGGASLDATGEPLTEETIRIANASDAVLMGAVGTPKYDDAPPSKRPEKGLLGIRKAMGVFANLRPVKAYPALASASPLKESRINGTDMLILRELTGGLYFGQPRGIEGEGKGRHGFNTMTYNYEEIERITRMAFELARKRRKKVTSVDKANVLETSQLWRSVVIEIAKDYPDVELDHLYVDNAAMQLILRPSAFDVILTENLFGDIISDEAAVIGGSIGLLPSGSLGAPRANGTLPGLYEPIHGSAPDIAGKGIANPLGTIGSVAVMLDWSFGLKKEAQVIYDAIDYVIAQGPTTPDLLGGTGNTKSVGEAVAAKAAELAKK